MTLKISCCLSHNWRDNVEFGSQVYTMRGTYLRLQPPTCPIYITIVKGTYLLPLIHHKRDSYHHLALFTGGRINILKRHVATDDNSNKKLSLKAFYVKFSLLPQTAFKAVSLNRHIIKLSRFSTFSTAPQTNHIFAENVALVYSFNDVLEYLSYYLPSTYLQNTLQIRDQWWIHFSIWALAVQFLEEESLLTPEIRGSNPALGYFFVNQLFIVNCIEIGR